jgi:hypothetical protein
MKYIFLLLITICLLVPNSAYAHEDGEPLVTASASAKATLNTFETFWPLTAGKTMGDSMYFLKTLKENLRGLLIFGAPEKGEYHVFRATKRLLEAESLMKSEKKDLALQTVIVANDFLTQSKSDFKDVSGRDELKAGVKNKLDKLIVLVDEMVDNSDGDLHKKLHLTHSLIEENLILVRK